MPVKKTTTKKTTRKTSVEHARDPSMPPYGGIASFKVILKFLDQSIRTDVGGAETVEELIVSASERWHLKEEAIRISAGKYLLRNEWRIIDLGIPREGMEFRVVADPAYEGGLFKKGHEAYGKKLLVNYIYPEPRKYGHVPKSR